MTDGMSGVSNVEKLSLLFELSRAFTAQIELQELLPLIMAQTQAALGAENCSLLLLDEAKHELFFPVTSDVSPDVGAQLQEIRFPAHRGIAGWVLQHGEAALVPDVTQDARFYPEVDKQSGAHTRDLLYAPLRTRSGSIGVIGLRNKRTGSFTQEDLAFLNALAGTVAIAIENARLYQRVKQSESHLKEEVVILTRERVRQDRFPEIVGLSEAMRRVFAKMESAIAPSFPVLLEGETGTGKELLARALHYNGPRKERPFIAVNCGALPEALVESELFGHKKGAFSGAISDKLGLIEAANGGTLFLDEIGEMPLTTQVKLLRALQEGEIRRVGETQDRQVDVRLISATNKDLAQEVQGKRFREDLYYRINVFPITVPLLRERPEDIPLLVSHFVRKCSAKQHKHVEEITQGVLALFSQYAWPGNVRELENEIERAVALTPDGRPILPEVLSDRIVNQQFLRVPLPVVNNSLKEARSAFEREYIADLLFKNQGNAAKTAKLLGLSRQMLQKRIKEFGLRGRQSENA